MDKELLAIATELSYLLEEIESLFVVKLALWANKCRALVKDIELEHKDIFEYIDKEVKPTLKRHREIVEDVIDKLTALK